MEGIHNPQNQEGVVSRPNFLIGFIIGVLLVGAIVFYLAVRYAQYRQNNIQIDTNTGLGLEDVSGDNQY